MAFTYIGNELVKNVYSSEALNWDDTNGALSLPIIKFKRSGIYVGKYNGEVTPVYETNNYDFDISDAGVVFYTDKKTIDIKPYGTYNGCEIADRCYVSGVVLTVSGNIQNHINSLPDRVYHNNKSTFDNNSNYYPLISPTTAAQSTSAWTYSKFYINNTAATFNNLRVNSTNGFYETSDETLKNVVKDIDVNFDSLLLIPKFYFTWKDGNDEVNIGTSAQKLAEIYPELVSSGSDDKLSVDYAKLSIIALKAVDELHKENLELKERLRLIEEKLGI